MIRTHFNLKDLPFKKDVTVNNFFKSSVFEEGLQRLDYLKNNRGVMLLTGEPGVGKTSLLRFFTENLNKNNYQIYYLPLSTVTVIEFYRQLNFSITGEYIHSKARLFRNIQQEIRNLVQNRKIVPVFIFDESHLLKNENFYELQIILNFDFDSVTPAMVILCGQSHLRDKLSKGIHAAFNRRISLKYHLIPLPKSETFDFIRHSLSIVGASDSLCSEPALEAIFNNSQGNLYLIANITTKALLAAAIAKKSTVSEEEVFLAAKEI